MTRKTWSAIGVAAVLVGMSAYVGAYRGQHEDSPHGPTYLPTSTIRELMDAIIDPSADDVWNAVKTTMTATGTEEAAPVTAEDWANVRRGAIRLGEAANLLMMPGRHMAHPGEKSATPGVELEPHEMEALVDQNRALWDERSKALHDVTLQILKAADAKDAKRLFDVGDRLDSVCEGCHRQFWYPNEKIPDFPANFESPAKPAAHE